jgi:hypothetical protein
VGVTPEYGLQTDYSMLLGSFRALCLGDGVRSKLYRFALVGKLQQAWRHLPQPGRPFADDSRHLHKDVLFAHAGSFEGAEAVIGGFEEVEGCALA